MGSGAPSRTDASGRRSKRRSSTSVDVRCRRAELVVARTPGSTRVGRRRTDATTTRLRAAAARTPAALRARRDDVSVDHLVEADGPDAAPSLVGRLADRRPRARRRVPSPRARARLARGHRDRRRCAARPRLVLVEHRDEPRGVDDHRDRREHARGRRRRFTARQRRRAHSSCGLLGEQASPARADQREGHVCARVSESLGFPARPVPFATS